MGGAPTATCADISMSETGLGGALFSRVQQRVLALLFGQPGRSFQASEVIKLAHSGSGAVQRELERLTKAGLVSVTTSSNRKLYQADQTSPIYDELRSIIVKTAGVLEPIRQALQPYRSKIDVSFVYGSIARGDDKAGSDVDLMIIGKDLAYSELYAALQSAEKQLLRSVSPTVMTADEWRQKDQKQNSFLRNVIQQPKLFVFGSENDLQGIGQLSNNRAAKS
jgi:predicted nucleotidyltransferase